MALERLPIKRRCGGNPAGEEEGFAVLYTRKGTGEIVGATLVAAHAGEMISELTLAITNKLPMKALAETVHTGRGFSGDRAGVRQVKRSRSGGSSCNGHWVEVAQ
jgi:hypothetical protein